ncbi:MAG TPA: NAD(+)/NADH kinase [Blastocatellia bacterium]
MPKTIAIFGGNFNPPGVHHRKVAEEVARHFDEVVIVPCGPRPDKPTTNDVDPIYRAAMVDMTFRGLDKVMVELFDLEQSTFTRTDKLDEMFSPRGETWHIVGTELIQGGSRGESFIQRKWERGEELWRQLRFAIVARPGFELDAADLPPNHKIIHNDTPGESYSIREKAFRRERVDGLVVEDVARYIDCYRLYRGTITGRSANLAIAEPRFLTYYDERNPKAHLMASQFRDQEDAARANCILVIGGDGTMLQAIRKYWRARLPFFGINAGHLGFLLNDMAHLTDGRFPAEDMIVRQLPLLYVETESPDGRMKHTLAFSDAWVERATSQTAWIEVSVNDQVRIAKLVSDGALVATAAGSTAYARSMGATPVVMETPVLTMVGSNVMHPPRWKSVVLSMDSRIEFRNLNREKRPLVGFADGEDQGEVEMMRIRVSRIAAIELAFSANHDMAEKIAQIQFPQQ